MRFCLAVSLAVLFAIVSVHALSIKQLRDNIHCGDPQAASEEGCHPLVPEHDPPQPMPWCEDRECPNYAVIRNFQTWEVRQYSAALWIQIHITKSGPAADVSYKEAMVEGLAALHDYRKGKNSQSIQIPVTVPLHVDVKEATGPQQDMCVFSFALFVPRAMQADPPQPLDARLQFAQFPEGLLIAARSFGGFATDWADDVAPELAHLQEDLTAAGIGFDRQRLMEAMFDKPSKLTDRHNEVWQFVTSLPPADDHD